MESFGTARSATAVNDRTRAIVRGARAAEKAASLIGVAGSSIGAATAPKTAVNDSKTMRIQ